MPRRRADPPVVLSTLRMDHKSPTPLYMQLAHQIEQAVADGALTPGDRIEGEPVLVGRLGISRDTVRHAIDQLVDRGILMRKHGVGTQVVAANLARRSGLISLYDELLAGGQEPSTRLVESAVRPAPAEVVEALQLDPDSEALFLMRLRSSDGSPLAIMRNWLPLGVLDLEDFDPEAEGLYEALRRVGISADAAHQSVGAAGAGEDEGRLLDLPVGAPVLTMVTTSYAGLGQPVEYGQHTYRPDRHRVEMVKVEK